MLARASSEVESRKCRFNLSRFHAQLFARPVSRYPPAYGRLLPLQVELETERHKEFRFRALPNFPVCDTWGFAVGPLMVEVTEAGEGDLRIYQGESQ